jgi:hypothetical protein
MYDGFFRRMNIEAVRLYAVLPQYDAGLVCCSVCYGLHNEAQS